MNGFVKTIFICIVLFTFVSCAETKQSQIAGVASSDQTNSETNTISENNVRIRGGGGGGGRAEIQTENEPIERADRLSIAQNIVERKIIRNANLTLKTNSPEEAARKVAAIAAAKNGFVVTNSLKIKQAFQPLTLLSKPQLFLLQVQPGFFQSFGSP